MSLIEVVEHSDTNNVDVTVFLAPGARPAVSVSRLQNDRVAVHFGQHTAIHGDRDQVIRMIQDTATLLGVVPTSTPEQGETVMHVRRRLSAADLTRLPEPHRVPPSTHGNVDLSTPGMRTHCPTH
jgi:hypothetical protein